VPLHSPTWADPASRLKQIGWNVWPFFVPPFLRGTVRFPLPVSARNRMGGAGRAKRSTTAARPANRSHHVSPAITQTSLRAASGLVLKKATLFRKGQSRDDPRWEPSGHHQSKPRARPHEPRMVLAPGKQYWCLINILTPKYTNIWREICTRQRILTSNRKYWQSM